MLDGVSASWLNQPLTMASSPLLLDEWLATESSSAFLNVYFCCSAIAAHCCCCQQPRCVQGDPAGEEKRRVVVVSERGPPKCKLVFGSGPTAAHSAPASLPPTFCLNNGGRSCRSTCTDGAGGSRGAARPATATFGSATTDQDSTGPERSEAWRLHAVQVGDRTIRACTACTSTL